MSKFDLKEFLGDLCKNHSHLEKLYDIIKKHRFEKVLANNGKFTFIMPKSNTIDRLAKKEPKNVKKALLNMFIPGKHKSVENWPSVVYGVAGVKYKIKKNTKTVEVGKQKIEFLQSHSSIPIWNVVGTVKHGGAFKSDSNLKNLEDVLTVTKFEQMNSNGGFRSLVVELYEDLDENEKKIADCFINNHPLAEFFLLFDSPFIRSKQVELNIDSDKSEKYREICNKKGEYLVNNKDIETINKLKEQVKNSNIIDPVIEEFYLNVQDNGEYEIDGKNTKIICKELAPYLQRLNLFTYMLNDYQKVLDDDEASVVDKYNAFTNAFTLNVTTNLKISYTEFSSSFQDENERIKRDSATFNVCGLILFKTEDIEGAREKPKKKKIIKLTPATRKILTSSSSSNK